MYTNNYWGTASQPARPYDGNWLTEFSQQAKNKMQGNAMQNYYQPQEANQPSQPNYQEIYQQNYQPEESLLNRYNREIKTSVTPQGAIGGAYSQMANQGAIGSMTNQMASYLNPDDMTTFQDESGEVFKIKKQPKPAYDWSTDFG